tara:strand:+ start:866 stop:1840 length:975 start_codon:yes stop_codon:yes gene_type:complete
MMSTPLLDIRKLTTCFTSPQGIAKAVDTVSLSFMQGETLAVVGESGCGKTVLALSILGLIPDPPGRITEGTILYKGEDLLEMDESELRSVRGNSISMIFQEPMTALNPVFRINEQLAEPLVLHQNLTKKEALAKAVDSLQLVGIANPQKVAKAYPHELSGGMRQRVMIAMALSCNPDLLIADEPTTALDVTIQAQILDLMNELKERMDGSLMLITHDLGVVARMAQRIAVMYSGKIVELAHRDQLFSNPLHPYTEGLLASVPTMGDKSELIPIPGIVPSIFDLPQGCRFHPRCPHAFSKCSLILPPLTEPEPGRFVRCWLHEKE